MTTPLCLLAEKYIVDKCPKYNHYYTPKYYEILKDKEYRKVLEIGIGYYDLMKSYTNPNYREGASLYMWKEFFKNANVYGADIKNIKLQGIETFVADQSNPKDLMDMMNNIGMCDFIIDDGSHILYHQMISFKTLWKYCNDIYIIEDVNDIDYLENELKDIFEDCEVLMKYKHPNDSQGFIAFRKVWTW